MYCIFLWFFFLTILLSSVVIIIKKEIPTLTNKNFDIYFLRRDRNQTKHNKYEIRETGILLARVESISCTKQRRMRVY